MPTKIDIKGVIIPNDDQWIYDWFEVDSTSPNRVEQAIAEAKGDALEVVINSGGGDVFSGSEIYTLLKGHSADVTVKIVGVAASAASVVAMAGNKVLMSPTAQLMMHNASTSSWGDKRDHQHTADFLNTVDTGISNAYRLKTGLSQSELLELMNRETWMNAQDALEKGFIDEIMFDDNNQLRAYASISAEMIPQKVINRMRNEFSKMKGEVNNLGNKTQPITNASSAATQVSESTMTTVPQASTSPVVDLAAQERARMKAIDAIAANIDPELVNEAKYGDNPMSAEQLAFRAMQEGKLINAGMFEAAVAANKAAGTDQVQAQAIQQNQEKEFDVNNLNDVNAVFSAIASNSQSHRPRNFRRG